MAKHTITLIPGDGIGPEVTAATVRILDAARVDIDWDYQLGGLQAIEKFGSTVPDSLIESISKNKIALKGPLTTPIGKGFKSANVTLRQKLDLYVNLRPVKSISGLNRRYHNVNLIVVRENTEDLYAGIETVVSPGVTHATKVVTEKASRRIAKWAFEYARANGRKKITLVHKANIMKITDGLFLSVFEEVAKDYPDIVSNNRIIDALCMDLVLDPTQYDMLVLGNLFGDIVSDLAAGLVGGLGLVPGANIGENCALFEAVHGTAPDIAGKNIANPSALIFSAVLMLRHIGEHEAANKIWRAMIYTLAVDNHLTRDLGGTCSTDEFANQIIRELN
ncbi:MAG: isocitrate/isopropylmalate dehydrogenase family protein [candidate division Zixibacteria bacterium]|nr:isocitrate/isopropylmalate dehydrogenase family protein [candidate division Zixibacteria bacterium]